MRPAPLLGRYRVDIMPEQFGEPPAARDMVDQAIGLILGEHFDLIKAAIDEVGQHKVNDAIAPAKGNGRLGAVQGQWAQTTADTPRENHHQRVFHGVLKKIVTEEYSSV